ncbi:MAG: DNA mismatch repair protein MutL, partial [Natronomonas sp.]
SSVSARSDVESGAGAPAKEPGEPDADAAGTGTSDATRRFRDPPAQRTLTGGVATASPDEFDRLPAMRVLGQFDETYLVAETEDGLVLIDQHAADERINFERLRERFAGDVTTQTLAEPVEVSLTAREAELATTAGNALSRLGFRVQRSDRTLLVTTVPALLAEEIGEGVASIARDLLDDVLETDVSGTVDSVADEVIGDLACHPSITANTSLTEGRVSGLLSALDACENPYACPHGRPTIIEFSRDEIDDRFERDYPGHAHRRKS